MVGIEASGSFDKTESFLRKMSTFDVMSILESAAKRGVEALASTTPTRSGLTANSWGYEIVRGYGSYYSIYWTNSNVDSEGQPIAILLQYGHATGTGGYVEGRD